MHMVTELDIQTPSKEYIQRCVEMLGRFPIEEIPEDCQGYKHAVAGQGVKNTLKGVVMAHTKDDRIFKPLQNDHKGAMELAFYNQVHSEEVPSLKGLRLLLAKFEPVIYFDATLTLDDIAFTGKYICLHDVLARLQNPSICDVKNGAFSYVPGSSTEKINAQISKYLHRRDVGFYIPGMRIYDPLTSTYRIYTQAYGRKLTKDTVYKDGILKFLSSQIAYSTWVVRLILRQLLSLKQWFEEQTEWTFISTSLLLAYEGEASMWRNVDSDIRGAEKLVVVKLIDFTHTYPNQSPRRDENFLFGLQNLINYFEKAEKYSASLLIKGDSDFRL